MGRIFFDSLIMTILSLVFSLALSATSLKDIVEMELDGGVRDYMIESYLDGGKDYQEIIKDIKTWDYPEQVTTGILEFKNTCIDGIARPFNVVIPEDYNKEKSYPLIVYLHGGVGRENIFEQREQFISEEPFYHLARQNDYIILYPYGQLGATWWDSVGYTNILDQIRFVKKNYNIDDNRVYMTGFSDGGSGSFFFAMALASNFAGFIPLNGHPGVASIDGALHTYFVNLTNSPLYVINTDLDQLYPAYDFKVAMDTAMVAGADLRYKIYTGIGHDFAYVDQEMPYIQDFINNHIRNPHPSQIVWETATPELGRYLWLSIDSIDTVGQASWHRDHNVEMINRRMMFGFYNDLEYEGVGVRVADTVGKGTLCADLGILPGDIIVECEGMIIDDINDMNEYKATKQRGDSAEVVILRDGERLSLRGKFPDIEYYILFRRELPSGRVEGYFCGNEFHLSTSQVSGLTIYIDPAMVMLDQQVKVYINDSLLFDDFIKPDEEFIIRNFLDNFDREAIYVNKISLDI